LKYRVVTKEIVSTFHKKPKPFKKSTITMHGFVEKPWKFYHKVFVPPVPVTLDDLKQRITTATAGVDEDMLTRLARIRLPRSYMPCD
jgi:hypothetical protein